MLHKTTGQSKTNERISITLRYSSTERNFLLKRSIGYRCINTGPLNIKDILGMINFIHSGYTEAILEQSKVKKVYKFGNYKKSKKIDIE